MSSELNSKSTNRKSKSTRPAKRRLSLRQDSQLNFQQLEARHLLAALTVTNTSDLTNADTSSITALIANDGGDGISLREAITATNNTTGEDTITFDGSVFTGGTNSLIRLTQGQLDIVDSLTIDASTATDVTITGDADGDDILFPGTFITDVAASFGGNTYAAYAANDLLNDNSGVINFGYGYLTLSSLTLTGGRASSRGGAISSSGDGLSLLDSTVSGNSTRGFFAGGGGIHSLSSEVSLTNSVVSRNGTEGDFSSGGGISVPYGTVLLNDSTVSGNSTSGSSSDGGGIFAESVTLTNSTVSGNSTNGDRSGGGGILIGGNTNSAFGETVLSLTDSTVSGNTTAGRDSSGGGILVSNTFGGLGSVASLINSVVNGNSTSGSESNGGGIDVQGADLLLTNSMVIGNSTTTFGSEGGGISANGNVSLTSSEVSGNSSSAAGGGIYASDQFAGFGDVTLSLTDSVVRDNSTSGDNSHGGGVNADAVVLIRSSVSGNSTSGDFADGGGVYVRTFGDLTAFDSVFSENFTTGQVSSGGGIRVDAGDALLTNSTVIGNSTSGQSSDGGGISSSSGDVVLTNSTVSGNSSTGVGTTDGGGVIANNVNLANSTISGNSTTGDGGGVLVTRDVFLVNSTITDNTAGGEGGGIFVVDPNADAEFSSNNSIIAGNTDDGTAPDLFVLDVLGQIVFEHSLIGDTTGTAISPLTGTGNILDAPALLGPLADNGGPTLTHALLPASPAIDAGSNALAVDADGLPLTTDQRDAGFTRVFGNAVDIGAFEVQPPAPTIVSATINEGGVLARPDLWNTLTVVFDSEVTVAANDLSLFINDSTLSSPVDLSGIGFNFDSSSNTATWDFSTLAAPLGAAFYTYQLDASSITLGGLSLDGNGDGFAGDDFIDRHYVAIPGDANLDGVVDVLNDGFALVANLNSTTNLAWANGNFNGDGFVNVLGDAFTLVGNLGRNVQILSDLVVTNATDLVNGDTGSIADLLANDGGDGISLREAIAATNNTPGENTITFDGSVFTGGANSLIRLTQGQLETTDSLTINAATGNNVTITGDALGNDITLPGTYISDVDGGGFSNFLDDNSRVILSSAGYLTLANVTVTGGRTSNVDFRYSGSEEGGGIYATGDGLSLIRSTVSGNSTTGGYSDGGGISAEGTNVSLIDSTVSDNSVTGTRSDGGGLYVRGGNLSLVRSTVSGNSTNGDFSGGGGISVEDGELSLTDTTLTENRTLGFISSGGAIFTRSGASVVLTNSLISGNRTTGNSSNGGGIAVDGPLTLINSTVSGNRAGPSGEGGGIRAQNPESILLINSTITANSASSAGGGLYLRDDSTNGPTIINSIIAGNFDNGVAPDLFIPDGFNNGIQLEHSLIGDTTGANISMTTGAGNILNTPAFLGPLADNGGATLTHAPLVDSPVINAGSNALAVDTDSNPLTFDQRGNGFDRIQVGTVDIGAFESTFDNLTAPPTVVSVTINEGGVLARPDLWNTLTVVFDRDVSVDPIGLTLFNDSPRGAEVDLNGLGFSYDSSTFTAIWDFSSIDPLIAGNYTYRIDPNSVTVGNIVLDANGDGIRGDVPELQHYVAIPGDANLDGTVDVLNDAFALVANLNSTTNLAWADGNFNGDSVVNVLGDAFVLVGNLGRNVNLVSDVVVSNTTDVVNGDTTSLFDLIADDGGDGISLREAIVASNNTLGPGTVTFDGSVFTGGANSLIRLTQGELEISESLMIDASTATDVTVTGDADGDDIVVPGTFITDVAASFGVTPGAADDLLDDNSRVFNFAGQDLTLSNITVTGGRTTATSADGGGILATVGSVSLIESMVSGNSTAGLVASGGGIHIDDGDVSLTNSFVSENSTSGSSSDGGGISVDFGDLYLTNSAISGNNTSGSFAEGGGIRVSSGSVTIVDSSVSGNNTSGRRADGGGISVFSSSVTIVDSSVSGNNTSGDSADGGGIRVLSGDLFLINSTVHQNTTVGDRSDGGGIFSRTGTVSLTNSTVSGNSATDPDSEGGGISAPDVVLHNSTITENSTAGVGGGIGSLDETITVTNSIIAGNTDNGTAPDLFVDDDATELVIEHSLIGDTTGSGVTASTGTGNILDQPALLGPLADNGGPTLTHALLAGSPAIDAGNDALAVDADGNSLTTDQRGTGFDRIKFGQIDIGAFESDFVAAPMTFAATAQKQSPSLVLAGDHELRDDVFGSEF